MFWYILLWNWVSTGIHNWGETKMTIVDFLLLWASYKLFRANSQFQPARNECFMLMECCLQQHYGWSSAEAHCSLSSKTLFSCCSAFVVICLASTEWPHHTVWYIYCCQWLQIDKEWSLQVNKTRLKVKGKFNFIADEFTEYAVCHSVAYRSCYNGNNKWISKCSKSPYLSFQCGIFRFHVLIDKQKLLGDPGPPEGPQTRKWNCAGSMLSRSLYFFLKDCKWV